MDAQGKTDLHHALVYMPSMDYDGKKRILAELLDPDSNNIDVEERDGLDRNILELTQFII